MVRPLPRPDFHTSTSLSSLGGQVVRQIKDQSDLFLKPERDTKVKFACSR
jgi:hypothetical protein